MSGSTSDPHPPTLVFGVFTVDLCHCSKKKKQKKNPAVGGSKADSDQGKPAVLYMNACKDFLQVELCDENETNVILV